MTSIARSDAQCIVDNSGASPSSQTAWRLLSELVRDGALQREGTGRGSKYVIPKRER
ncbi:MAG: hypothetical protein IMZ75_12395 [Actinobacteria bacterium]|nr:hypothetical protein [Actinomycetota bacterium]